MSSFNGIMIMYTYSMLSLRSMNEFGLGTFTAIAAALSSFGWLKCPLVEMTWTKTSDATSGLDVDRDLCSLEGTLLAVLQELNESNVIFFVLQAGNAPSVHGSVSHPSADVNLQRFR
jgi:hypothetical protein